MRLEDAQVAHRLLYAVTAMGSRGKCPERAQVGDERPCLRLYLEALTSGLSQESVHPLDPFRPRWAQCPS